MTIIHLVSYTAYTISEAISQYSECSYSYWTGSRQSYSLVTVLINSMKITTLIPVLIAICNSVNCYGQETEANEDVAVWVARKSPIQGDLYRLRQKSNKAHTVCRNSTFMVQERECVKNEDILKGKLGFLCCTSKLN